MTCLRLLDRLLSVLLLAVAGTALVGSSILLLHGTVPDWLLPVMVVAAVCVPRRLAWPAARRPHALVLAAGALVLAVVVAAIAFGALATPSRHWDGAVAWDMKAGLLTQHPSLEQPAFRAAGVYCHSCDYPLLQPLLLSQLERLCGVGRLWFPLAFLMAAAAIGLALRRRGADGNLTVAAVLAFALTPQLVNPSSGAYDSGYADGMLCTWVTLAAAGLLVRDRTWIALGVSLAVLTKPEGMLYGGVFAAAAWLAGASPLLRAAVLGLGAGAALQLPLQHDLLHGGDRSLIAGAAAAVTVLVAVLLGSDAWMQRRGAAARRRWQLAVLAVPAGVLVLPWLPVLLGDRSSAFGTYLAQPSRVLDRLDRIPAIVAGVGGFALLRGSFGLTWLLPLLGAIESRRSGTRGCARPLGLFLVLLLPLWIAPFLLSPIADLDHHLRSTLPRLLLHTTGAAWLFTAATISGWGDGGRLAGAA